MSLRQRLVDAGHDLRVMAAVVSDAYVRPLPRAEDGPLVTVLIAAYNRSAVLRYALASAVGQTYRNLEILVIGDACTDDSEQVVAAAGDPRVRWMNLERNCGSQAGPNQAGLEAARGQLIAYLGQDDVWRHDHVALLVADIERTGADATSAVPSFAWPKPVAVRRLESPRAGDVVPTPSLMHTRDAGLAAGGWRDHRQTVLPPDADFIVRLRQSGARFSRVRALSLLKFASALRRDSYRDGRSDEQAAAARRVDGRAFAAREVLAALASMPLRPWYGRHAETLVPAELTEQPGGVIAEYRRIRGLQP
ncbi:MAG: glycosyltransferase family 2 protein [Thermoleophilaceae bacterium]